MSSSQIFRCAGLIVVALTLCVPPVQGSDDLVNLVYSDASRAWAGQLNSLLSEPGEMHATVHEDGVDRRVVWLNYENPPRRLIRSESARFLHVHAVNHNHAFEISARQNDAGAFWLNELNESASLAAPAESYELFLPEATFMGYPLVSLVRRDLVTIDSVEPVVDKPSQLLIKGRMLKTERLAEPPFAFFASHFLQGTDLEVCVAPGNDWKLINATVRYPHGTIWYQENSVDTTGQVVTEVVAKNAGTTTRSYTRTLVTNSLRPFDDSIFYLPHYGLSESTAGFLMGSRRYILVFCALFFGAVFFRVLAYVVKRRRIKNSEAAR
jgi:hypothetical protein